MIKQVPSSARIATIKVVHALTSLALMEAKDLIERLPEKLKEAVGRTRPRTPRSSSRRPAPRCPSLDKAHHMPLYTTSPVFATLLRVVRWILARFQNLSFIKFGETGE